MIYVALMDCNCKIQTVQYVTGPSRATAGPGKTLSRGPVTPPPLLCLEIASRGRKRGERCPLTTRLGVRGSVVTRKIPQRGLGRSPGRKWILSIFYVRMKASGTPFSLFLSDGGAPQMSRGSGKLSPLSPLSTGLVGNINALM